MIHFVLIRHGQTQCNKEKRFQGRLDSPLTALGKKQIQKFNRPIKKYKPQYVFSSPTGFCLNSAKIVAQHINKKVKTDRRLCELSFGQWEGLTADELLVSQDPAYAKWYIGQPAKPKHGESIACLEKRISSFIAECRSKYDNKRILIFTHGGCIRMFLKILLKLNRKQMFFFRIDPGTATIIGDYDQTAQLIQINQCFTKELLIPPACV